MTSTSAALIKNATKAHEDHLRALRVRDRNIRHAVIVHDAGVRYVARAVGLSPAQVSRICNPPAKKGS